ncbi:hypothetical protein FGIG_06546, partial [Fasciola gigantica]
DIPHSPDQLQEPELASLLGLKLALEKQPNELPQFMIGSRSTKPAVTRSGHLRDSTFQSEVRIQVQVSDGRWSVICEVESMYLNHNVHLVCPLMQPRCFENSKHEVSQSPFSSASLAMHGMNNSASGSLKVVRTHEARSNVCRPVSWISPIANNSRTMNQRQSSGCSVTNSKSCHFASLSVQLGGDSTLINPVTSHQFVPSAPLRYWAASPITTSLYPSVTDACAKPMEGDATLDFSCNRWTNHTPALRSSCSFSSNGYSVDDSFGAMHRSVTLPFAPEANRSYMPMPVYMTTSASRTPSQTSVGVRLLPSHALPRWLTPPQRCSSKVRLIPKSKKETAENIHFEKHRLSNAMNGPQNSETLVIEKNILARKLHPLCGVLHKPTPSQLLTGTVTAASVEKETDMSEITGNGCNIGRINEQNRFMQRENGKSSNFHHVSPVPQVTGL